MVSRLGCFLYVKKLRQTIVTMDRPTRICSYKIKSESLRLLIEVYSSVKAALENDVTPVSKM